MPTNEISQSVVALIGAKELELHQVRGDLQAVVDKYNDLVCAWMIIDGFLLPLMKWQRHLLGKKNITSIPSKDKDPLIPSSLFAETPDLVTLGMHPVS